MKFYTGSQTWLLLISGRFKSVVRQLITVETTNAVWHSEIWLTSYWNYFCVNIFV